MGIPYRLNQGDDGIIAEIKGAHGGKTLAFRADMDALHVDEEINAKAAELILDDTYDFIVVYNGNYDTTMHKFGPESAEALAELRTNSETFATFSTLIANHWKNHNTLVGFAMDHGCHEIDGGSGSHGLDMDEDLNIVHLYKAYPAHE